MLYGKYRCCFNIEAVQERGFAKNRRWRLADLRLSGTDRLKRLQWIRNDKGKVGARSTAREIRFTGTGQALKLMLKPVTELEDPGPLISSPARMTLDGSAFKPSPFDAEA